MAYGAITGQKPTIDLSPYATKSELNNYALKTDLNSYATIASLNNYVKKTDMPNYVLSPQLIVNTLAGATVTAKSGSKTVTGTANSSGVCTLNLNAYGTWNVSTVSLSQNVVVDTVKQYDVSFGLTTLGEIQDNGINEVALKSIDGYNIEYYILKHNYESGLNGNGITVVINQSLNTNTVWNSSNINTYANSTIDNYLNTTEKNKIAANFRSLIKTTKFYYTPGNGNNNMTTLSRNLFMPSITEMGVPSSDGVHIRYWNIEGSSLGIPRDLMNLKYIGSRSPRLSYTDQVCLVGYGFGGVSDMQAVGVFYPNRNPNNNTEIPRGGFYYLMGLPANLGVYPSANDHLYYAVPYVAS